LKIQYHINTYVPGSKVFGMSKQPVQRDLSMLLQKFGQFWKPLKSIVPSTWVVKLVRMSLNPAVVGGSAVTFTGVALTCKSVSGIHWFVQLAAT